MGLLAPLELRREGTQRLEFSSGWGTATAAAGLIVFGLIVWLMRWLARPLLSGSSDALLNVYLPAFLAGLGALLMVIGLGLLGYRQALTVDRERKILAGGIYLYGLPLRAFQAEWVTIADWTLANITPKRYRADSNLKDKPVGYWELAITTREQQRHRLDRAPYVAEIQALQTTLAGFMK